MKTENINLNANINLFDILDSLSSDLDYEELLDFIKELDLKIADWDFTEQLYNYFKKQHEIFLEEEAEILKEDQDNLDKIIDINDCTKEF